MFWIFQQNRRYARIIMQHGGALAPALTRLMTQNDGLEDAIGAIRPVFCHNNLSPEAILEDGQRLWLIDWSHGGWNDGLYDLASLATNLGFDHDEGDDLLRQYLALTGDEPDLASRRRFAAWKCSALLWSGLCCAIGEMFSTADIDFAQRGQLSLERLALEMAEFKDMRDV
jgi:thiamine kinase-like enzyme